MKKRLDKLVQKEMDLLDGKTPKSKMTKKDKQSVAQRPAKVKPLQLQLSHAWPYHKKLAESTIRLVEIRN